MRTLILALAFAAPVAYAADIVIGQSAPLSGSNADFGTDIRDGALAYFKKVNDAGGINGNRVRLVTLDDKNDAKLSGPNAQKLVNEEKVVALFGFGSSTLSLPAMPVVKEQRVPFFAPFTGATAIRKQNDYVYTIRASYGEEIEKILSFWGGFGLNRVAVLHYDDEIGLQNFQTAATYLERHGKTPTSVSIKRNADLDPAAADAVVKANPDVLLITTLAVPGAQLIKSLKAKGKTYTYASLSFAGTSQLVKAAGPDAAGIGVAQVVPLPKDISIPIVGECASAWKAAGQQGAMSPTALESCVGAKLLTEALRRSGKDITRESLARALDSLGRVDVGGLEYGFVGSHHAGRFVDLAVVTKTGELRN